jgi:hypothetical protein
MKRIVFTLIIISIVASCATSPKGESEEIKDQIKTYPYANGVPIEINFEKGESFYYPLIVFWIEDTEGNYIETIYASQSIATGTFRFGVAKGGKWMPGERRRQAALPYWGHRRGFKAPDGLFLPTPQNPLPDAITGATPKASFKIQTTAKPGLTKFKVYMEINQTWDWNHHWHNNLFPDDDEYKTSCQPALVYMASVDMSSTTSDFELKPIGHSHPSGKTGELFTDLSTISTALKITKKVTIKASRLD